MCIGRETGGRGWEREGGGGGERERERERERVNIVAGHIKNTGIYIASLPVSSVMCMCISSVNGIQA